MFGRIWMYFFAWMPLSLQIALFGFLAFCAIVLILRAIALVLDAIPLL